MPNQTLELANSLFAALGQMANQNLMRRAQAANEDAQNRAFQLQQERQMAEQEYNRRMAGVAERGAAVSEDTARRAAELQPLMLEQTRLGVESGKQAVAAGAKAAEEQDRFSGYLAGTYTPASVGERTLFEQKAGVTSKAQEDAKIALEQRRVAVDEARLVEQRNHFKQSVEMSMAQLRGQLAQFGQGLAEHYSALGMVMTDPASKALAKIISTGDLKDPKDLEAVFGSDAFEAMSSIQMGALRTLKGAASTSGSKVLIDAVDSVANSYQGIMADAAKAVELLSSDKLDRRGLQVTLQSLKQRMGQLRTTNRLLETQLDTKLFPDVMFEFDETMFDPKNAKKEDFIRLGANLTQAAISVGVPIDEGTMTDAQRQVMSEMTGIQWVPPVPPIPPTPSPLLRSSAEGTLNQIELQRAAQPLFYQDNKKKAKP